MFGLQSDLACPLFAKALVDNGLTQIRHEMVTVQVNGKMGEGECASIATFYCALRQARSEYDTVRPVKVEVSFTEEERAAFAAADAAVRRVIKQAADDVLIHVLGRRMLGKD
jgi:hypothetical protein